MNSSDPLISSGTEKGTKSSEAIFSWRHRTLRSSTARGGHFAGKISSVWESILFIVSVRVSMDGIFSIKISPNCTFISYEKKMIIFIKISSSWNIFWSEPLLLNYRVPHWFDFSNHVAYLTQTQPRCTEFGAYALINIIIFIKK